MIPRRTAAAEEAWGSHPGGFAWANTEPAMTTVITKWLGK
jgi:hypothetical protein